MRVQIAVVGPNAEASQQDLADAAQIGREIAERGVGLSVRDGKPTVCLRPWEVRTGDGPTRQPLIVRTAAEAVETAFRELA